MSHTRMLVAVILLAVLGTIRPVQAQHSSMSTSIFNDETTFAPALSHADLDVFTRVLSMKPEEQRAMEDLYGAYCNTLKAEGGEVRKYVSDIMEESELMEDIRLLAPAQKRLGEWEKRSEQLKKSFIEDLKALLTREQEGRWPIVERELRRMKWINSGRLAGEDVDLIHLVAEMPADAKTSPALGDLLDRYSQDLDRALLARADVIDKNSEKFGDLLTSDPQAARSMYESAIKVRRALCDVNLRYARLIGAELPSDLGQKLDMDVFKISFPMLSKPSRGERYIKGAKDLKSLTAEQEELVKGIVDAYENDRLAMLHRTAETIREQQFTQLPVRLDKALGVLPPDADDGFRAYGLSADHPLARLRRERFELDKAARNKLDAILTPEQRASLPDRAADAVTFIDYTPWGL